MKFEIRSLSLGWLGRSLVFGLLLAGPGCAGLYEVIWNAASNQSYNRNNGYVGVLPKGGVSKRPHAVIGTLTVSATLHSDVVRMARMEAWKRGGDALTEVNVSEVLVPRLRYGHPVRRKELQAKALVLRYEDREAVDSLLLKRLLRSAKVEG